MLVSPRKRQSERENERAISKGLGCVRARVRGLVKRRAAGRAGALDWLLGRWDCSHTFQWLIKYLRYAY